MTEGQTSSAAHLLCPRRAFGTILQTISSFDKLLQSQTLGTPGQIFTLWRWLNASNHLFVSALQSRARAHELRCMLSLVVASPFSAPFLNKHKFDFHAKR